jgi:pectinesterase
VASGSSSGAGTAAAISGSSRGSTGSTTNRSSSGSPSSDGGADSGGAADAASTDASSTAGPPAPSTATRPQLSDTQAANDTALQYLAQAGTLPNLTVDHWNPIAGVGDVTTFTPSYVVASDGSGTHTTVQAAITAAKSAGGSARVFVRIQPGTYRELVCLPAGSPPITLYSVDPDPTHTTIVFNDFAGGPPGTANPCNPSTSATLGTFSSATFMAFADGFEAKNLTIANDYAATSSGTGQQAVALMTEGDRLVLENLRLTGFQDTLFLHTAAVTTVARVYVKNTFIQGDTDYVFGRATAVFDGCTIDYVTSRRGGAGTVVAPSTDPRNPYGFLVVGSNFTQSGTLTNSVYLGRAWDNGVASAAAYVPGTSPNGQTLIRESALGSHIRTVDPWAAAATSGRPFSATGNRLYEYRNSGPGAAQ